MTAPEIHLKCLELAMAQAKNEGKHGDIDSVALIETRFYTICTEEPQPKPAKGTKAAKDKALEDLFQ